MGNNGSDFKLLAARGRRPLFTPVFTFQPFRGNPDYDKVTDLPYDTVCLAGLAAGASEININAISK